MKKALKRTIIITGSIAGALVLTIIILSAIIVKPLKPFMGLDYNVTVANTALSGQNEAYEDEIKDKLSSVKFSVMRSLLELNADYGIKHAITTVDGDEEYRKISASSFLSLRPSTGQYMLKFTFKSDKPQTYKKFKDDDGNLIKFDSLMLIINESSNNIQPVIMYPYLSGNLNNSLPLEDSNGDPIDTPDENGAINSAYYSVYEFSAKMYTSTLYNYLLDKGFTTGSQSA